jgi:hypothetical protein
LFRYQNKSWIILEINFIPTKCLPITGSGHSSEEAAYWQFVCAILQLASVNQLRGIRSQTYEYFKYQKYSSIVRFSIFLNKKVWYASTWYIPQGEYNYGNIEKEREREREREREFKKQTAGNPA